MSSVEGIFGRTLPTGSEVNANLLIFSCLGNGEHLRGQGPSCTTLFMFDGSELFKRDPRVMAMDFDSTPKKIQ